MPFDVRGAKAAGYSDAEIMAFMQQPRPVAPPAPTMQDLSGQLDPSVAYPGWVQTGVRKLRDLMQPSNVMGGPVIDPEEFVPTPTSVALDLAGAALPPGVKLLGKGVKALEKLPAALHAWEMPYKDLAELLNHSKDTAMRRLALSETYGDYTGAANDFAVMIQGELREPARYGAARVPTVQLSERHRAAIRKAMEAGETVPAEVLAEYPDLKPKK